jgi:TldD protein
MTQNPADLAPQTFFFDRFGLDAGALESTLGSALARRADFADLYFEFRTVQGVSLEEGSVKKTTHSVSQGVGVRVLAGDKTGYAYSDEVTAERLQVAAQHARQIASAGTTSAAVDLRRSGTPAQALYPVTSEQLVRPLPDRIALLESVDRAARAYDPRIVNVMASLAIEEKVVLIANSAGELVSDRQPLLRLQVACIAEHEGRRHSASAGGVGRVAFEFLIG